MFINNRSVLVGLVAAIAMNAAKNPTPPNTVEIAVSSEVVPAGGTMQAKFSLTEPQPITSTGAGYALESASVNGVAVWSPDGTAGGVGVVKNGYLYVSAISPTASLATNVDYPFLTITSTLPASLTAGTTWPLTLTADTTIATATGPMSVLVKPGKLVVGGSISIQGVYPGGGTWPGGTVVKVIGSGFSTRTRVTTKMQTSSVTVMSPNEIDLVLKGLTTIDAQKVTVVNPDGSTDTYFPYLRGVLVRNPSRVLLQNSEPAFALQTHALASLVVPALTPSQFEALALQNPNPGPLVVTFELDGASGTPAISTVILPSGGRLVDDLSSLLNGVAVSAGNTFKLTATAPLQILGLLGDESAVTVSPFFPTF